MFQERKTESSNHIESKEHMIERVMQELAERYSATYQGKDLIEYKHASLADLADLIRYPQKYAKRFEFTSDEVKEIRDWTKQALQEWREKKKRFAELKERHRNNPLFKEGYEGVPSHFMPVYHFTGESCLSAIGEKGLQPSRETMTEEELSMSRVAVDEFFDSATTHIRHPGLKNVELNRSGSVYAYPDYHATNGNMGKGGIMIEIMVDPSKAAVVDAGIYTQARMDATRDQGKILAQEEMQEEIGGWAERYWKEAVPLTEYWKRSLTKRRESYTFQEVVIKGPIDPKFMRVIGVEHVT